MMTSSNSPMTLSVTKAKSRSFKFSTFFVIFQNIITSAILISTSENNTTLWICKLGCITGIENSISQMVKIEQSENFHPGRKMKSSLKMAAFLKKYFTPKTLSGS